MRTLLVGFLALATVCCSVPLSSAQDTDAAGGDRQQVLELIQAGSFEEAVKLIDEGDFPRPMAQMLYRQVMNAYMQKGNVGAAQELLEKNIAQTLDRATRPVDLLSIGNDIRLSMMLSQQSGKQGDVESWVDAAMAKLAAMQGSDSEKNSVEFPLAFAKMTALRGGGKEEQAAALADEYLTRAHALSFEGQEGEMNRNLLVSALTSSLDVVAADKQPAIMTELRELVTANINNDPKNLMNISSYSQTMMMLVNRLQGDQPDAAEQALAELREMLETITEANADNEDPALKRMLDNLNRSAASLAGRIEAAKKFAKLIGSPAPAIDAQYWVHGEVDLEGLRGKVVLLDFWAVWCGPCIATFPHLRHLHEEYADDGLQIIGVTRKYNFQWDDQAGRAVRAEEPQADEDELAMLEKFITHHELQHPTIVTPEKTTMNANYGVSGIPHAVVIDKKGVIRLVKVGSGDENAKAIEATIQQCLQEEG